MPTHRTVQLLLGAGLLILAGSADAQSAFPDLGSILDQGPLSTEDSWGWRPSWCGTFDPGWPGRRFLLPAAASSNPRYDPWFPPGSNPASRVDLPAPEPSVPPDDADPVLPGDLFGPDDPTCRLPGLVSPDPYVFTFPPHLFDGWAPTPYPWYGW